MASERISDIGEKRIIREFLRPLFNETNEVEGVGDDCAMVECPGDEVVLFSTDRVPADLHAFRLGILNVRGLGDYLARLNISDIAACGGRPVALLLNLGLPRDLSYIDFQELCRGVKEAADRHGVKVLGGDLSSAAELTIVATSVGITGKAELLTRRGASEGDTIFVSRPLGLTPGALAYYLMGDKTTLRLPEEDIRALNRQFTGMEPMVRLGRDLATSGQCTSCMDNTDGVGQTLLEIAEASCCRFVIDSKKIRLPDIVHAIASHLNEDPISFALGAGADLSLIGTLRGAWNQSEARARFGDMVKIIGRVECGDGIYCDDRRDRRPVAVRGWNYFAGQ